MIARFHVENFSVKDAERLGRPRTVDTDKITTLVDPHMTVREIHEILDMSHESAFQRRRLCEQNECVDTRIERQRLNAFNLLLEKNKEYSFLKKMITKKGSSTIM